MLPFNKFGNGVDDDMVDAITENLTAAETGAHLWADHVDAGPDADGYSVEDIIRHMALALSFWVADAESKRIAAESNPDAAEPLTRMSG